VIIEKKKFSQIWLHNRYEGRGGEKKLVKFGYIIDMKVRGKKKKKKKKNKKSLNILLINIGTL
jgi:hypothetical protein